MSVVMQYRHYLVITAFLLLQMTVARAGDMHTDLLRPIIAQIVSQPEEFKGQKIELYGLVVGSNAAEKTFMLQDVSQRPLLIDGHSLPPIKTGDQVEVAGFVRHVGQEISLVAKSVKRVKVLGGGGCC
ncbi:MAG: hypothetical protein EKK40_00365 [Bradyrhizobiaceae bacterium]|nr:MAG: hypothetical protein EKK40_00365 [Bradyrhizobiaceae bacterium]